MEFISPEQQCLANIGNEQKLSKGKESRSNTKGKLQRRRHLREELLSHTSIEESFQKMSFEEHCFI